MRTYFLTLMIVSVAVVSTAAIWSSLEDAPHLDVYDHPHVNYSTVAWDLWQMVQPGIH
jgi:hypothetical protein